MAGDQVSLQQQWLDLRSQMLTLASNFSSTYPNATTDQKKLIDAVNILFTGNALSAQMITKIFEGSVGLMALTKMVKDGLTTWNGPLYRSLDILGEAVVAGDNLNITITPLITNIVPTTDIAQLEAAAIALRLAKDLRAANAGSNLFDQLFVAIGEAAPNLASQMNGERVRIGKMLDVFIQTAEIKLNECAGIAATKRSAANETVTQKVSTLQQLVTTPAENQSAEQRIAALKLAKTQLEQAISDRQIVHQALQAAPNYDALVNQIDIPAFDPEAATTQLKAADDLIRDLANGDIDKVKETVDKFATEVTQLQTKHYPQDDTQFELLKTDYERLTKIGAELKDTHDRQQPKALKAKSDLAALAKQKQQHVLAKTAAEQAKEDLVPRIGKLQALLTKVVTAKNDSKMPYETVTRSEIEMLIRELEGADVNLETAAHHYWLDRFDAYDAYAKGASASWNSLSSIWTSVKDVSFQYASWGFDKISGYEDNKSLSEAITAQVSQLQGAVKAKTTVKNAGNEVVIAGVVSEQLDNFIAEQAAKINNLTEKETAEKAPAAVRENVLTTISQVTPKVHAVKATVLNKVEALAKAKQQAIEAEIAALQAEFKNYKESAETTRNSYSNVLWNAWVSVSAFFLKLVSNHNRMTGWLEKVEPRRVKGLRKTKDLIKDLENVVIEATQAARKTANVVASTSPSASESDTESDSEGDLIGAVTAVITEPVQASEKLLKDLEAIQKDLQAQRAETLSSVQSTAEELGGKTRDSFCERLPSIFKAVSKVQLSGLAATAGNQSLESNVIVTGAAANNSNAAT